VKKRSALRVVLDSFEFVDSKQDGPSSNVRTADSVSSNPVDVSKSSPPPAQNKEDDLDDDVPF